ncbi:MAG TPA: translation initiation factor [Chitinophagaceae bacterium]|nr:translation initiation factor [Chitinophagaceae bacterium]
MAKKKLYNAGIIYSTDPAVKISIYEKEESETLPPKEQLLIVRLDAKHRGGKMVTLVYGFSGNIADLEKLGKQLKSYCGTGGSVKNNEILIQGDNREKISLWLNRNGYFKTKKI